MLLILALAAAVSGGSQDPGASTPVAPPAAASSAPTKAANPKDDPDRVICRTEAVTGSRFTHRVCMTKAQMDERQREFDQFERQRNETNGLTSGAGNAMDGR
jgi:hypothetical protein